MPKHPFDSGGRPPSRTPYDRPPSKSYYIENEGRERRPSSWTFYKRNAIGHSISDENDEAKFGSAYQEPQRGSHRMGRTYSQPARPRNATTQSEQDYYRREGNGSMPYAQGSERDASVESAGVAAMRALIQSDQENAKLAAENEGLRRQLSDLRRQVHDLPAENNDLRWKLSSFRQRAFDLQDEKEDMRRQLSAACQRVRELESQLPEGWCTLPDPPRGRGTRGAQSQLHNSFAQVRNTQGQLNSSANKSKVPRPTKGVEK